MLHDSGLMIEAHRDHSVDRWSAGSSTPTIDAVAEEIPVALVFNGISHAVMLASPQDLEDFAVGFSLSEGIVAAAGDIKDVEVVEHRLGIELHIEIVGQRNRQLRERQRALAGRTGCGMCGIESLDQLIRRPPTIAAPLSLKAEALENAHAQLGRLQELFKLTGAVHAAAWCNLAGDIALVREDVGRHNALDKLIGARASDRAGFENGFVLMTSRASYEIVLKAATVGIAALAAVSAPTGMAVRMAEEAGMTLIGFARGHSYSVYSSPERAH